MQHKRLLIAMFFVISVIVSISIYNIRLNTIHPHQGVLDLTHWKFSDGKPSLQGDWEFYWNKLLLSKDFDRNLQFKQIVPVPKTWDAYYLKGKPLPGFGYATYRLKVVLGQKISSLSLKIDTMSTAYKLYINDVLLAKNGKVGVNENVSIPQYQPNLVHFVPPGKEFFIIVQVSNFTYSRGGFWYEMNLGTDNQIDRMNDIINYKDAILIGALLIMVLYYASFYFVLTSEKSSKYFVLLCLIFIVRTSIYGDSLITKLFQNIPFNALIFLTYVDLYWIPMVIYLLVDSIFQNPLPPVLKRIFTIYALSASVMTAILPIHSYTSCITVIEIIGILMVIASVYIVLHACLKKENGAGLMLLSVFIILLTGIHDVLYQANVIYNAIGELASIGIFIFIFTFSFILASKFSLALDQSTKLTKQLADSLENEKNATEELIQTEMSFLKAQIKPHFIYNSLSVIASFITEQPYRAKELLYNLTDYLRGSFNFENYKGMTPIKSEIETVKAYLAIEQARFQNKLQVTYQIDEDINILVPLLTIQPIVENAVRHGILKKTNGGTVQIKIENLEKDVWIEVCDDGIGIESGRLKDIMENNGVVSGVGLKNINRRLNLYYQRGLNIHSIEGIGTTVTIRIPQGGRTNESYSG